MKYIMVSSITSLTGILTINQMGDSLYKTARLFYETETIFPKCKPNKIRNNTPS